MYLGHFQPLSCLWCIFPLKDLREEHTISSFCVSFHEFSHFKLNMHVCRSWSSSKTDMHVVWSSYTWVCSIRSDVYSVQKIMVIHMQGHMNWTNWKVKVFDEIFSLFVHSCVSLGKTEEKDIYASRRPYPIKICIWGHKWFVVTYS